MAVIDLNSDLGESYGAWRMGDDAAMLSIVSSANVACGFHAGDPAGILATVRAAAERDVAIGAHVSYPDRVGFGRRDMDVTSGELVADVIYQIGALKGIAAAAGTTVRYVKPHGALYNRIAHDPRQGRDVIEGIRSIDPSLVLMGLAGSPILNLAREAGLAVVSEAFADRAYTPEGALVSRREVGAVLHDAELIARRMLRLAGEGTLEAIDGSTVRIDAQSICVHGDSPGAVAIAREIRRLFEAEGIEIRAFPQSDPQAGENRA
ncbi:LamB/YcsF family protein [Rhizobium sp. TRM95111]|uniref:LamB/YcsF family protein n=1 Tax=Rhizobium alarense TaxID=2846851 RepID=UPI001F3C6ABC|nr:5-oxoprolinase subunit PxpA [Rhizobium alarense]MCF3641069.1 LamB/YcsF family protein [Rhizobium alarense]